MTDEEKDPSKGFFGLKEKYDSSIIYSFGIVGWMILWGLLYYVNNIWNLELFGNLPQSWAFSFPFVIGFVVLVVNAVISRHDSHVDHKTELKIIEFVERNSSWFLIGSSAIFAMATLSKDSLGIDLAIRPFIIYVSLYLLFLCFVIFLFWTPNKRGDGEINAKKLNRLRHSKTVPFTYAVSFFTAAVITLLLSVF